MTKMSIHTEAVPPDADAQRFAQRVLGDVSAAMTGLMVRVGHELGLYRALGEHGPLTSRELAQHASVFERYAREWLHQQRAAGYLDYERESAKFGLTAGAFAVLVAEQPGVPTSGFRHRRLDVGRRGTPRAGIQEWRGHWLGRA